MSLAIILGYSGIKRTDEVTNLYTGPDLAEARRLLENPPEGIVRTELIINPTASRRKIYTPLEVVDSADAPPADAPPADAPPADAPPADAPPADAPPADAPPADAPPADAAPAEDTGKKSKK